MLMGAGPANIGLCLYPGCKPIDLYPLAPVIEAVVKTPVFFYDESWSDTMREETKDGFIGTLFVLGFLILLVILGIITEYTTFMDTQGQTVEPSQRNDKSLVKSKNKLGLFFLSFSLTRNNRQIMSTGGSGGGYDTNL